MTTFDQLVLDTRRQFARSLHNLPTQVLVDTCRELGYGDSKGVAHYSRYTLVSYIADSTVRKSPAPKSPVGPGESTPDVAPVQPDYQGRHLFDEARSSSFFRRYGPRGSYGFRTQERAS